MIIMIFFLLSVYLIWQRLLQGKRGVWIKLPVGLVNLVEVAVKVISHYLYGSSCDCWLQIGVGTGTLLPYYPKHSVTLLYMYNHVYAIY